MMPTGTAHAGSFLTHVRLLERPQGHRHPVPVLGLIFFVLGGLLAMAVRWQLAWPWADADPQPVLFSADGGQMPPEFYNKLFTMHATIMIFFVIIPLLTGAFGNFLIPLMIGAATWRSRS